MTQDRGMTHQRKTGKSDSLVLSSEDRRNGFSITADDRKGVTLLKWGKPVAWFSAAVPEETLRV